MRNYYSEILYKLPNDMINIITYNIGIDYILLIELNKMYCVYLYILIDDKYKKYIIDNIETKNNYICINSGINRIIIYKYTNGDITINDRYIMKNKYNIQILYREYSIYEKIKKQLPDMFTILMIIIIIINIIIELNNIY